MSDPDSGTFYQAVCLKDHNDGDGGWKGTAWNTEMSARLSAEMHACDGVTVVTFEAPTHGHVPLERTDVFEMAEGGDNVED